MSHDMLELAELAYTLRPDLNQWCEAILPAIRQRLEGCPIAFYTHLSFDHQFNITRSHSRPSPSPIPPKYEPIIDAILNPQELGSFAQNKEGRDVAIAHPSILWTQDTPELFNPDVQTFWERFAYPVGINHSVIIQHGTLHERWFFILPLKQSQDIPPSLREQWTLINTHLGAALRLQHAATQPTSTLEESSSGILSADGEVVDLFEEPLKAAPELQEALRFAAKSIDKARGKLRRTDPLQALALWKGLVDGQFSLVDHFDTDGKRYILLKRNAPETLKHRALSFRERQVLTAAAQGLSNKLIAYELGLTDSTVSTLLQRAFQKLNISSRLQLIELAHQLLHNQDGDHPHA